MKLRHYETFYLLDPELNEDQRESVLEKIKGIITEDGGEIVAVDNWPLRKLAYRVNKKTHGYYVLVEYGARAGIIEEITRNLRLDERVMKFLTSKLDDDFNLADIMAAKQTVSEADLDSQAASSDNEQDRGEE